MIKNSVLLEKAYYKYNTAYRSRTVNKVFWNAFILRAFFLILILVFYSKMESGFISSNFKVDDWRYLEGASRYARSAKSLFDFDAFLKSYASLQDWVGYNVKNEGAFAATPLWYYICCGFVYIFRSVWSVRIFTMLLSSLSVIYIYQYASLIYGKKVALLSSRLFAYLPYPAIFSCFAYKDHLFLFLIFFVFAKAAKYRKIRELKKPEYLCVIGAIIAMLLLRSGFTVLIVAVAFWIAINPDLKKLSNKQKILLGVIAVCMLFLYVAFRSIIAYKLGAYVDNRGEELASNTISFLTVNSIFQIYKLPFAYIFATVSPINVMGDLNSWYSVVANLNLTLCPVSAGSCMYLFDKKDDKILYLGTLSLFLITIVTSINIFRHYYSLMPFIMIFFSAFWSKANIEKKLLCILISAAYALLLCAFFISRKI